MTFEEEVTPLQERLEKELDFLERMNIQDEILELKIKHGIIERSNSCSSDDSECLMCGA